MYLEIVSPEAVLFSSEVDSVTVPGVEGQFQMLNNHAPIVSILQEGTIFVNMHNHNFDLDALHNSFSTKENDDKVLTLEINSGTVELNDNKIIILAD